MSMHRPVLFVCLHGAAKSVLAAADFQRMAAERGLDIPAVSAGTEPDAAIAPGVLRILLAEGVDLRGRVPRGSWHSAATSGTPLRRGPRSSSGPTCPR